MKKIRCAIYTRKSAEEGLEQNLQRRSKSLAIEICLLFKHSERVIEATVSLSEHCDEARTSWI